MLQIFKFIPVIRMMRYQNHCRLKRYSQKSLSSSSSSCESEGTVGIRHNFHKECEEGLNKQINLELHSSYTYFCMSTCLSRVDVALPGYAQFFAAAAAEEHHHAQLLASFVNTRGGVVELRDVPAPTHGPFHDPAYALQHSIDMERSLLETLEELHTTASTHGDNYLTDFLVSHFIKEGYEGIRQLTEMLSRLKQAGPGVGVVLLDSDMLRHPLNMHYNKQN